jgi:hypothetical protein
MQILLKWVNEIINHGITPQNNFIGYKNFILSQLG